MIILQKSKTSRKLTYFLYIVIIIKDFKPAETILQKHTVGFIKKNIILFFIFCLFFWAQNWFAKLCVFFSVALLCFGSHIVILLLGVGGNVNKVTL